MSVNLGYVWRQQQKYLLTLFTMFWLKTGASFGCHRLKPFYLEIYSPITHPLAQIIISS